MTKLELKLQAQVVDLEKENQVLKELLWACYTPIRTAYKNGEHEDYPPDDIAKRFIRQDGERHRLCSYLRYKELCDVLKK